jgi:hypothetical protein
VEHLRAIGRALDARSLVPSTALLAECRQDLMAIVQRTGGPGHRWAALRGGFDAMFNPVVGLRRLAAAAALVAFGFLASRVSSRITTGPGTTPSPVYRPADEAGFVPGVVSGIRSVSPGPSGEVQIALDETRSQLITGSPRSEMIQKLLLSAARNQANPGLRVESIEILKDHSDSEKVLEALLQALARDPNPGVRLAAIEGLKPLASEAKVRDVLTRALVTDGNPAVRIQAIELLTQRRDDALVGVLQDLVQKDENNYVRMRCRSALREMNASVGAF